MGAPLHADAALLQALDKGAPGCTGGTTVLHNNVSRTDHVGAFGKGRRSVDNSVLERRVVQLSEEALQACAAASDAKCWRPGLETVISGSIASPRVSSAQQLRKSFSEAALTAPLPPRILVAEDNMINVRVMLRVLSHIRPDAEVDVAGNGVEVLEAVQRKEYDLILMDIHMPGTCDLGTSLESC